jgi:hypothetical protein
MRAKEFISEQYTVPEVVGDNPEHEPRTVPGAYVIPDASKSFYQMYRYGIMMARSPEPQPDAFEDQTSLGDKLIVVPYSEGGMETIQGASKATGKPAVKAHTKNLRDEDPTTNHKSPVPQNSGRIIKRQS